jgi:hypothetical protein
MKPVTVQEVLEAISDLSMAVLELSTPDDDDVFKLDYRTMRTRYKELAGRIRTHGIALPDGMMLVPIEPTKEMMLAAEEAYMPFGDTGMALLCGNLAAAPKQENTNE